MRKILALLILLAIPAVAQFGGPMGGMRPGSMQGGGLLPGRGGDPLWVAAGPTKPKLDLDFAKRKDLTDAVSGKTSLVTFSRSAAQSPGTYVGADGLIHDAAVNLELYSEQFDNAAWLKVSSTVLANQAIAPDGKQTADRLTPSAANALHYIWRGADITSANISNYSVYVKADGYSKIALRESKSYGSYASFDLSTGTVLDAAPALIGKLEGYGIENVGDGWYRIYANFGGITLHRWGLWALPESYTSGQPASSWLANGTDGYLIWGAQLEETDPATMAPTAYIKTTSQTLAAPRFDHTPTTGNVTTNLLKYSEMLDVFSAWTPFNSTVTANATTDPDGSTNADRVTLTNGNLRQKVSGNLSGQTFTYSFYAKTVSGNLSLPIHFSEASTPYSLIGSDTISVTNDWQKFTVTVTLSATSQTQMNVWFGSGSGSTGDFYVYQAQLETGSSAGTYVRTLGETRSISDAVAPSLGLLVEEQRANAFTNSEDLSSAGLIRSGTGVTPVRTLNYGVAPDGTQTAERFVIDRGGGTTSGDYSMVRMGIISTTNQNAFWSFYAKSLSGNAELMWYGSTDFSATVNIKTQTIGNDWVRLDVESPAVINPSVNQYLWVGSRGTFGGDDDLDVLIWGVQAEKNTTFLTSYIPTTGSAQTRYADVAAVQDEDFSTTNLLAYSESFDVGWGALGLGAGSAPVITSNYGTAPDGTPSRSTRIQFDLNGGTTSSDQSLIYQVPQDINGTYTNSIYIKGAAGQDIYFGRDLSNKIIVTTDGTWQRANFSYTNKDLIVLGSRGTTGSSDSIDVEIWGASLTATEYPVEYTTTRNLLTDSQDFERSTWSKSALSSWNDGYQDPFGGNEGFRFVESATTGNHGLSKSVTYQAGDYVLSFYAKKGARNYLEAVLNLADGNSYATFDVDAGTVIGSGTGATATITDVGNGWFRCTLSKTLAAGSTSIRFRIGQNSISFFYLGDGVSDIYLYGMQLEPGTTATDYVRTVDVVGKSYNWYEPTEGTVRLSYQNSSQTGSRRYGQFDDGSGANRMQFGRGSAGTNNAAIISGGALQFNETFAGADAADLALGFDYNDTIFAQSGGLSSLDTTVTLPIVSRYKIGSNEGNGENINGHIKRLTYWPVRQSDSTLQVITE